MSCSPSAVGLVGVVGYEGRGGEVDWFDATAGWRRLPPIEPERGAATAAVAQSVGAPLVWIGDRISILRDGVWSPRSTASYLRLFPRDPLPVPSGAGSVPVVVQPPQLASTGRYLVGRGYADWIASPALLFVDAETLPPVR